MPLTDTERLFVQSSMVFPPFDHVFVEIKPSEDSENISKVITMMYISIKNQIEYWKELVDRLFSKLDKALEEGKESVVRNIKYDAKKHFEYLSGLAKICNHLGFKDVVDELEALARDFNLIYEKAG